MDVTGIGIPCIDFLAHIERLPAPNQSTRLLEYSWQGGGKVPTAMIALARLGAEVGFIGVIGDCTWGRFCLDDFHRHGVDTSHIIVDKGKTTSFSLVLSDKTTEGRNIIYHPGSARQLLEADLPKAYICSGQYLHLSDASPASLQAATWAQEEGVRVVFDADSYSKSIENMLPLIDIFIASEFYYRAVAVGNDHETTCLSYLRQGCEVVVFTLGANGCIGADAKGFFRVPGLGVDVQDTTGAGDVFHGAFIYGLLQGWDTRQVAQFANAVAAIKCTRIGGRAGIPDLKTVVHFLETGVIDYSEIDQRVKFYGHLPNRK